MSHSLSETFFPPFPLLSFSPSLKFCLLCCCWLSPLPSSVHYILKKPHLNPHLIGPQTSQTTLASPPLTAFAQSKITSTQSLSHYLNFSTFDLSLSLSLWSFSIIFSPLHCLSPLGRHKSVWRLSLSAAPSSLSWVPVAARRKLSGETESCLWWWWWWGGGKRIHLNLCHKTLLFNAAWCT